MEKKTIGQFIAALRKASGMTQKQLSERLNVSDKAVSRWERDECAPDLSLIPVIAEIFGVTSDEILRGERKFGETDISEYPVTSAKSTKQIERILNDAKLKFSIRSIISVGIAIVGLLGAMLCNFGFNRASIGFIVACILYIAAVICQSIFVKLAYASIADEEFESEKWEHCKRDLFNTAFLTYAVILTVFVVTLPLAFLLGNAYLGLVAETWLTYGLVYGIISVFLCAVFKAFSERLALRLRVYTLSENEKAHSDKVFRFDKKMISVLVLIVCITFVIQIGFSSFFSIEMFSKGRTFDSVDEFVEFMETPAKYNGRYYSTSHINTGNYIDMNIVTDYNYSISEQHVPVISGESDMSDYFQYYDFDEIHYFDENGNEISEEEALGVNIHDKNGELVKSFIARNETVAQWSVDWNDDVPTFTVYTQDDFIRFYACGNNINSMLAVLCVIEILVIGSIWFILRRKIK